MNSGAFFGPVTTAFVLLILPASLAGCARTKVTNLPDGAHRIVCERGMKNCVTRAEKLCEDKGYTVLSGASKTHLLGGSSSSYRQLSEQAELEVICGERPPSETSAPLFSLPARRDGEPSPEEGATGSQVTPSATACVPGTTQKCVGAGACDGGQVCLPDGSGYGVCDCGPHGGAQPQERQVPPAPQPPLTIPPPGGEVPPRPVSPTAPHAVPEPTPVVAPPAP